MPWKERMNISPKMHNKGEWIIILTEVSCFSQISAFRYNLCMKLLQLRMNAYGLKMHLAILQLLAVAASEPSRKL
jgi:hypothetical protein